MHAHAGPHGLTTAWSAFGLINTAGFVHAIDNDTGRKTPLSSLEPSFSVSAL